MDKKNLIIAVLAALLILGSLWGSVGDKNSKMLRRQLEQAEEQLASVEATSNQARDAVLKKAAELQKVLQAKDVQLGKARKELVALRKANKGLEAKLSERDAAVQKLTAEKSKLAAGGQGDSAASVKELQKKITLLKNELKKKNKQLTRKQGAAGKGDVADLQGKIVALQKEVQEKDQQLAKVQSTGASAQVAELQQKVVAFQQELESKNEQLAEVQDAGASEQVADLQQKVVALKDQLRKKEEKLAQIQSSRKQFVRLQGTEADQVAELQEKIVALQGELKKKDVQGAELEEKTSALQAELQQKVEQLTKAQGTESEQVAALKGELKTKDEQFAKMKSAAADQVAELQNRISVLRDEVQSRGDKIAQMQAAKKALKEAKQQTGQEVAKLQETLADAETAKQERAVLGRQVATANAQIIGLEKIVEEKNAVIEEISRQLDRVKINMDVLLNKIADQQDGLQEVQEENRELIKELAAKNETLADLQEKMQAVPAQ